MHQRLIPATGESIPIIGLGTWQTFDVGHTKEELDPLREVLKVLIKYGGSVIDSSPMYGRSEKVVGNLTRELGLKDNIFEATKVWTTGEKAGQLQIQNSISLLDARPLDLLQIHNLVDWKTHIKTLRNLKDAGKIRYIGITHYLEGAYPEMEKIMKQEKPDFIQINYNLAVRDADKRILPLAKDKGIAVLINRPYEGGTLFRKFKERSLPAWAGEFDASSWGQLFLKFILSNNAVTCVIPGTSKPRHMEDNAQAGFGRMPDLTHKKKLIQLIESI
ncbi:MAG: aldo/keto reductase [Saprospiraceae bacterium]|nr:aldo/keto reductase [Saprospiraceae bacterium]